MEETIPNNEKASLLPIVKSYGAVEKTNGDGPIPRYIATGGDDDDNNKILDLSSDDDFASSRRPKRGICGRLLAKLDPTDWLVANREQSWGLACLVRECIYKPDDPDFSSVQLHSWAVILGAIMGLYTFLWKNLIESGIELLWATIPHRLFELGVFTDQNGHFPLYHYMWIVPALLGGLLSYIFAVVPMNIPDQNAWITCVHCRGMQDYEGFWTLFVLSTLGMLSGLSLGPELPLVLTGSMVGAWFSKLCQQTILKARVLSLLSASAAVGGFFGFPMAGAFFVLELPHRMGIEYYEAMGPSVLASIVAVLMNRWLNKEEFMTGYFQYPALTESVPSGVFSFALVLGLFGALVGFVYAKCTKQIKTWVHDWSRDPSEGTRSAVSGAVAGALVGVIAIFLPHVAFWGEAQLQNLIDSGLSPLPIFGDDDEATLVMVSQGYCLVDPSAEEGFGSGCAVLIALAKIIVIGLSLGTGILGGHFWGPLYVGCAAAHAYTDVVNNVADMIGYGQFLAAYPAIVILCFMGSAHVVTFRAHIAIALILTLTISSFGNSIVAKGDYAVVLPLLVIAVFVAGIVSRKVVFYKAQQSRGDINLVPEVLCQPGMEGRPWVVQHVGEDGDTEADDGVSTVESVRHSAPSTRSTRSRRVLHRMHTFGELTEHEPELLEQSRIRSASSASGSFRLYPRTDSSSSSQSGGGGSVSNGDALAGSKQPEIDMSKIDRANFYMASHGGFVINNV